LVNPGVIQREAQLVARCQTQKERHPDDDGQQNPNAAILYHVLTLWF
jgi:hypothetical protein